jgi:peptidyl-prolyl cis-trans isomerase B (cyclophilin B)
LFINGDLFQAPLSYFWLDAVTCLELLKPEQFDSPPPTVIDLDKRYTAIIKTDKGEIDVELDTQQAPITVNNFVYLAQRGWYDGVTFFRMLPGYIVQTGDPTDTGLGGPGYELPPEIGLPHTVGALAMARRPDEVNPEKLSNGSQFFITLSPLPELDGDYTVFGYVTQGIDVLQELRPRDPDTQPDAPPGDQIITIEIHERPGLGDIE